VGARIDLVDRERLANLCYPNWRRNPAKLIREAIEDERAWRVIEAIGLG
jgi:hypothetical protein